MVIKYSSKHDCFIVTYKGVSVVRKELPDAIEFFLGGDE